MLAPPRADPAESSTSNSGIPTSRYPFPAAGQTPATYRFGLSLTLGFGGFDTSLIFEVPR